MNIFKFKRTIKFRLVFLSCFLLSITGCPSPTTVNIPSNINITVNKPTTGELDGIVSYQSVAGQSTTGPVPAPSGTNVVAEPIPTPPLPAPTYYYAVTDGAGDYYFENLPVGDYQIYSYLDLFVPGSGTVKWGYSTYTIVTEGSLSTVNLLMTRSP